MRTDQQWQELCLPFDKALEKLGDAELKVLCCIFECSPYDFDAERSQYVQALWTKFWEWRRGADDAKALREAISVLRLR